MTGMCETEISRFLKLLDLPADVQDLIDSGELSYAHARAFIPMLKQEGGAERISFLAVKIVKNDWTTRDLNRYLKAQEKQAPILETLDAPEVLAKIEVISSMEEKLKTQFQSTVDIKPSKNKGGKIVLNYASDEELHRLFELLNK